MYQKRTCPIEGTAAIKTETNTPLRLVFDSERDDVSHEVADAHAGSKSYHMPRDYAQFVISALAMVLALIVSSWALDTLRSMDQRSILDVVPCYEMSVSVGDSLWSIAESHPVQGVSTPELVEWIKETNGLESSALGLGQRLSVPCRNYDPQVIV